MIQLGLLSIEHMADVLRIQDYCYTEIEPENIGLNNPPHERYRDIDRTLVFDRGVT